MKIKEITHNLKWKIDWLKNNPIPGPPFFINIEPTNICNLNCTICSLDRSRKPGYMSMALFNEIVTKASDYGIKESRLFLAGEPLLNKNIVEMIKSAKSKNLKTTIHSNATTLTNVFSHKIIDSGLDILSISFHGDNKEKYERIMVGADYDKVLNNVISFLELLKRSNQKTKVIVQIVKETPKDSLNIDNNFTNLFNNLPVHKFIILKPHNWAGEVNLKEDNKRDKLYFPCQHLYQSISIAYNGDVFSCCGDLNGRMIIDNIKNKSIKEIWHSEKFKNLRLDLKNKEFLKYPLCTSCDVLWRKRHPVISEIAASLKLPELKNKIFDGK